MKSNSESYKASGVDITAGYKAVELMKTHIARTRTSGALGGVGGFGGCGDFFVRKKSGLFQLAKFFKLIQRRRLCDSSNCRSITCLLFCSFENRKPFIGKIGHCFDCILVAIVNDDCS